MESKYVHSTPQVLLFGKSIFKKSGMKQILEENTAAVSNTVINLSNTYPNTEIYDLIE